MNDTQTSPTTPTWAPSVPQPRRQFDLELTHLTTKIQAFDVTALTAISATPTTPSAMMEFKDIFNAATPISPLFPPLPERNQRNRRPSFLVREIDADKLLAPFRQSTQSLVEEETF